MDLDAFTAEAPGILVPFSGTDPRTGRDFNHKAFIPNPLPPEPPPLGTVTWRLVARASLALGRLEQAAAQLPDPRLLRHAYVRKEAVSTSALEGTYAAFEEVLEGEMSHPDQRSPEVREVLNYARAAERALDWVSERPITVAMLCELQRIIVAGTAWDTDQAGQIRTIPVVIGPRDAPIEDARFVPPPPGDQLEAGFREWQAWIGDSEITEPVVAAALGHYQFETLHPFNDGNGRVGRLVVALQLIRGGINHEGLLTISPWLEPRRDEYQDLLLRVSQRGELDPWVAFFCAAVEARATAVVGQTKELLAFRHQVHKLVREHRLRGVARDIAEDLVQRPVITVSAAAEIYGVTYPAANNGIGRLVELGLLREQTGRTYDRRFGAPRVLEIIQS